MFSDSYLHSIIQDTFNYAEKTEHEMVAIHLFHSFGHL